MMRAIIAYVCFIRDAAAITADAAAVIRHASPYAYAFAPRAMLLARTPRFFFRRHVAIFTCAQIESASADMLLAISRQP